VADSGDYSLGFTMERLGALAIGETGREKMVHRNFIGQYFRFPGNPVPFYIFQREVNRA